MNSLHSDRAFSLFIIFLFIKMRINKFKLKLSEFIYFIFLPLFIRLWWKMKEKNRKKFSFQYVDDDNKK